MGRSMVWVAMAALYMSGCSKPADNSASGAVTHGRFVGVGIYPAGRMWSQVVTSQAMKQAGASKLNDDEQIIVVVDSTTGELRQCGNLSGYCVGMNPWRGTLPASQNAPLPLAKHAAQLAQEAADAAQKQAAKPTVR